jgi:hypothetical protein
MPTHSGPSPHGPVQKYPSSAQTISRNPKDVDSSHQGSDLDSSSFAQHHTLGFNPNQASPGHHVHDGSNSKLITDLTTLGLWTGTALISFTTLDNFTQAIVFPITFVNPPTVMVNIGTGSGFAARWGARAFSVTTTGFSILVFAPTAGATQTWVNGPVNWLAVGI